MMTYLLDSIHITLWMFLSIVDSDKPVFRGSKRNAPMFIDGNEYSFLILPVNVNGGNDIESLKKQLDRAA